MRRACPPRAVLAHLATNSLPFGDAIFSAGGAKTFLLCFLPLCKIFMNGDGWLLLQQLYQKPSVLDEPLLLLHCCLPALHPREPLLSKLTIKN